MDWKSKLEDLIEFAQSRVGSIIIGVVGVVFSLISFLLNHQPWSWVICVLSLGFAGWRWAESLVGGSLGVAGGLIVSFLGYYLLSGLDTGLTMASRNPAGCASILGKSAEECLDPKRAEKLERPSK